MCGVAGILAVAKPIDRRALEGMIGAVTHRGPDAIGVYVAPPIGLAHARLSIIDLSGGAQPMHSADGRLSVSFNGEIFNYLELREDLLKQGHRFSTRSDTEVILHAYEEYGDDCVRLFNGQWAIALWDAREQRFLLSRDRLGVRPLFYATTPDGLLFASEIKALFAHPAMSREIDPIGLDQIFTFLNVLPPRTVFDGIAELPPGCSLAIDRHGPCLRRYWQLDFSGPFPDARSQPRDLDEPADELIALLSDATRLRLRSDVPVGAYLSGGLDSTIITALACREVSSRLKTFSVSFDDPDFDEGPYQRAVAALLGTEHHTVRCTYADIGRAFPQAVWHAEKPLLWTAPTPLLLLSALVRSHHLKVVLTGEGADEFFGGYDIFKETKIRRFCAVRPDSTRRPALLRRAYPYLQRSQTQSSAFLATLCKMTPADVADPFFSHLPRWSVLSPLKRVLFSQSLKSRIGEYDALADLRGYVHPSYGSWDYLSRAQYLEVMHNLSGYLLSSQGDRVAMAHGIEGRFPFLDHRVIEFATRLPSRLKLFALREKVLLKHASRSLVPDAIVRRRKQPYRAPLTRSFFDDGSLRPGCDYVSALLSTARVSRDDLFSAAAVRALVDKVRSGRAAGIRDNWAFAAVLSTQLVIHQFVKARGADTSYATA